MDNIAVAVVGGDAIELIAAIIVALVTLGAVCYVIVSVIDLRPSRRWWVSVLRASAALAAVRVCCLWWLMFGFNTLWSPLPFLLMMISFYPEGYLLESLGIQMSQSSNAAPAVFDVMLYSLFLIFNTFLEIGLLVGIVAAIRRVARG